MSKIRLDSVEITRDGKVTKEFAATFRYKDLMHLAQILVVEELVERGELTQEDGRHLRVESRMCEPDGEMGYPGSRVEIVVMHGPADYYPYLLEHSRAARPSLNILDSSGLTKGWPGAWRRLRLAVSRWLK